MKRRFRELMSGRPLEPVGYEALSTRSSALTDLAPGAQGLLYDAGTLDAGLSRPNEQRDACAPDLGPTPQTEPPTDDDYVLVVAPGPGVPSNTDIGDSAARKVFEAAVAKLQAAGASEVEGVDLAQVRTTRRMRASGRPGDPSSRKVQVHQYIFSAPRFANGIPIAESSLAIAIARDGRIASVRTTGAVPTAPGPAAPRQARHVTSSALLTRLKKDNRGAAVRSLGLQYIAGFSTGNAADLVEPLEVFMVFPSLKDRDGQGRGFRVACSVMDPDARPIEL
jgi:hypothetical protein